MFTAPLATAAPADAPLPDAARHRALLNRVLEIAGEMAEMLLLQAKAQTQAEPAPQPARPALPSLTRAFDDVARTIRHGIMLAHKLAEPAARFDPAQRRVAARRQIIRTVEDNIQRHAPEPWVETLRAELFERLDGPDLDGDIDDERAIEAIITDLCHDLGLGDMPGAQPWVRRTPADIAELCARAAAPRGAVPWPIDPRRETDRDLDRDAPAAWHSPRTALGP